MVNIIKEMVNMCGCCSCRKAPPVEVCKACKKANGGCKELRCLNAFLYDDSISDEKKVAIIRENYVEGGQDGKLDLGNFVIPEKIQKMLEQQA